MNRRVFGFAATVAGRLLAAASPAGAVLLTFGTDGTPTNTAPNGGSLPPAVDTITKTVTSSSFPNGVTITENVYAGTTTDGIKGLLFTYQFTNAVGNAAIEAVALFRLGWVQSLRTTHLPQPGPRLQTTYSGILMGALIFQAINPGFQAARRHTCCMSKPTQRCSVSSAARLASRTTSM